MPVQYESIMTFESKSSKTGKCYTVKRRLDTGTLSCDCAQWVFNKNGDRTCYHTERVKVLKLASSTLTPVELVERVLYENAPERPTRKASITNEGPITERPRQLRLEKKERG